MGEEVNHCSLCLAQFRLNYQLNQHIQAHIDGTVKRNGSVQLVRKVSVMFLIPPVA